MQEKLHIKNKKEGEDSKLKHYIKVKQEVQILNLKEQKTKDGKHTYGLAKVYANGQLYSRVYVPAKLLPITIGTFNVEATYFIDLEEKKIELTINNVL